jgi:signal transduction histidine kinase/CheY-like chemotaxis protein
LIPAAVYAVHADGTIAYFNQHAADLWGQSPVLGSPDWRWCGAFEIFEADGTPIVKDKCLIIDVLAKGITVKDYPMLVDRPDGSRIQVAASVGPIRDSTGNVIGAINTFRDVTEQKRGEDRLRSAVATAESANAAKDRFLAMLSHELRTPLAPVVMTVAAMETDPDLPPRLREDVSMVRRNVELEARLIDDLLDLSRVAHGKLSLDPRPVHLHDLLRHVLQTGVSDTNGKRITVVRDFAAGNDRLVADPARLQQIFWNLLRNAIKFTPAGGTIHVRTRNVEPDGALRIDFADTGVGIPAAHLTRIFDAFEQAEPPATTPYPGGLGLGLAIAKAVVELHHGTITASSPGPGLGATFTVLLDAAPPTADVTDRPATLPPGLAHKTTAPTPRRLLLVDDHPDTLKVLSRLLSTAGYDVCPVGTVADALAAADTRPFDLLVSDIGLPDASGYDLMTQIRQRHRIMGVALSGYGMDDDVRRAESAGFCAHIAKPVDLPRLLAVLDQISTNP